jgi:hypothetical protein
MEGRSGGHTRTRLHIITIITIADFRGRHLFYAEPAIRANWDRR